MPYPEMLVAPMREDLTRAGFRELKTAQEVDDILGESSGTLLVAVNSVCGCAAGAMRPALVMAMGHETLPEMMTTVFAGQDLDATDRAREYFHGYPPSSPSVAIMKDGELVYMMERHQIEGHHPMQIAEALKAAFDEHCG